MKRLCTLLGLIGVVSACGPQPDPTTLITKARIIGATFAVEGAPERSTPVPGETLNIELMITQKLEPVQHTWGFIVCKPAPVAFGIGFCESEPLALGFSLEPSSDAPNVQVQIPDGDTDDLLIIGAVCMGGIVNPEIMGEDISENANPCVDEGVGQIITGAIPVADPEDPDEFHLSPRIAEVRFGGEVWEDLPPAELTGCAGSGLIELRIGLEDEYEIEVVPEPGSRESFITFVAGSDGGEESRTEDLPVAFYATDLGLSTLFSVIDAEPGDTDPAATPVASVEYATVDIEDAVGADGRVIRFEMVMRDDRGGTDRATRALCLVP